MKKQITSAAFLAMAALAPMSQAEVIVGTGFTGRSISGTTVTINDYTINGVANPGAWTVLNAGSLMDSADAQDRFVPADNAPSWQVLVPINVGSDNINLTDVTISFEAFNNSQVSKTGISGGFSPNYQGEVRLLDAGQAVIDSELVDAQTEAGTNLVAAFNHVFTFVSNDTLLANTNYFIEVRLTGASGNNVGLDDFTVNGTVVPEPTSLALLGLGTLLIARRRRG